MKKITKIILTVSVGIFIICASLIAVFYFNLQGVCRTNCNSQVFVAPQGATLNSILEKLEKEKIVRSALVAKIYLKFIKFKGQIQAGDFKLNPRDDVSHIITVLQKGTLDFWVTIPEGWRAEQVWEKVEKARGNVIASEAKQSEKIAASPTAPRNDKTGVEIYKDNEGYLFPDTYLIPKNASDENVVSIMRSNFNNKIKSYMQTNSAASPSASILVNNKDLVPVEDLIILASLVEREAKNDEERPIIAGIIYKRWKAGWPLQVDATVQYAVGNSTQWWKKELTLEDLKVDSPYNTYKIKGLPPVPICNPGLAAIEAVINQKLTDYWYYSTGKDGVTRYSVTLDGHNANIDKFIKNPGY